MSSLNLDKLRTKARKWVPFLPPKPISPLGAKDQYALLFTRLPPELRWMIWDTCFRRHVIHVYPMPKRVPSREPPKRVHSRECLEPDDVFADPHWHTCGRKGDRCNHITLLLTCKAIYFECLHRLYRETLFDFSHGVLSLVNLPQRLPPAHLALVSRVNVMFGHCRPLCLKAEKLERKEVLWEGMWKALAAMEGLEWLRFELMVNDPEQDARWTGIEWTLWEGVKKVTRPSHFELILPFPAAASTREETLPCTVIRRLRDPTTLELD